MKRSFSSIARLFVAMSLLGVATVSAQSPAQLRPQFPPSLPPTFRAPPPAIPSPGPAVHPYVAPVGGSFQNGAQAGVVTRQGQSAHVYAGPGYGGAVISTPTNIGGK